MYLTMPFRALGCNHGDTAGGLSECRALATVCKRWYPDRESEGFPPVA